MGRRSSTARHVLGNAWPPHPHLRPAVLRIMEVNWPSPRALYKLRAQSWIIDYEFRPFGRTGLGEPAITWVPRKPSVAHLYAPGTRYIEDTRRLRGRRQSAWIDFVGGEGTGLERLTAGHGFARFLDPSGLMGDLLHAAARGAHERGQDSYWQVQACLCNAMNLFLLARHIEGQTWQIEAASAQAGPQEFVDQAQAIMKEHLAEPLTLGQIARALHVSVSSLAHRYRQEAGEPPKATMVRLRLEQARGLLQRGHSVKVVADQLGFADAAHLSKAFKRHTGLSPREFLRRHGAGSGRIRTR